MAVPRTSTANHLALLLGIVHMFVDCATGFVVTRDVYILPEDVLACVVLYNALAFGTQFLLGLLADRWRVYRGFAVSGVALLTAGLLLASERTWFGVVLLGLGNAMFHVGAGAHVLRISGRRSAPSGIFIGPGAIGLASGLLLGAGESWIRVPLALILFTSLVPLAHWAKPVVIRAPVLPRVQPGLASLALLAGACLVGSVVLRALVGGNVIGPWRLVSLEVVVALAAAACAGKMAGGLLGDRLGWLRVSVVALLIAAPLLSVLGDRAAAVIPGMLLFTMTTAMSLKALHHVLPDRPGLAFGLPTLALLIGRLPDLYGHRLLDGWVLLAAGVVVAAVLIAVGLKQVVRAGGASGPADAELPIG